MINTVGLRAIEHDDLRQCMTWRNRDDIRTRTRENRYLTMADQQRWYDSLTDPESHDRMFMVTFDDEPVGVVGVCDINWRDRHAEISFYLGEQTVARRGITRDALHQLHLYAFRELGLHTIWAEVYAFNTPGYALLTSLGYHSPGVLREHVWRFGGWHDAALMQLSVVEWKEPRWDSEVSRYR